VCIVAIVASAATLLFGFHFVNGSGPDSVAAAVAATAMGPALTGAVTLLLAWALLRPVGARWCTARAAQTLKEGWPLFASQFVSALYTISGPIIINLLLDAQAAGAYSAVERVINAILGASLLTHTAAYPLLAASYVRDRASYRRVLRFVLSSNLIVTAVAAALAWAIRDKLVEFLFGDAAAGHGPLLAWGLVWLMVGGFGTALTGYLTVSGRSREVMPLTAKILVLAVSVGVPAIKAFGPAGWMAALAVSQVVVLHTGYRLWGRELAC
jgi:O-antigen/teichoic acid export membrane protein